MIFQMTQNLMIPLILIVCHLLCIRNRDFPDLFQSICLGKYIYFEHEIKRRSERVRETQRLSLIIIRCHHDYFAFLVLCTSLYSSRSPRSNVINHTCEIFVRYKIVITCPSENVATHNLPLLSSPLFALVIHSIWEGVADIFSTCFLPLSPSFSLCQIDKKKTR